MAKLVPLGILANQFLQPTCAQPKFSFAMRWTAPPT
ncbi:hypothetical protein SAMN05216525_104120 [Bradyrhizobium sp. Gha]|nr:hypothetical protein SAMN05216525_104120 [Bradyrhizobium sp. Gha]